MNLLSPYILYLKIKLIPLLVISIIWNDLIAQSSIDTSKLSLEQVEVIKSFEVNLAASKKIDINPTLPKTLIFKPTYNYDITLSPLEIKYPEPEIRPLSMFPDAPFIIKNGYIFGCYGFKHNPALRAGYYYNKKDSYSIGADISYDKIDNSNNVILQKYSNSNAHLYSTYLIKENLSIHGGLRVGSSTRYLYHTDVDTSVVTDENLSKRNLDIFDITLGISNPEQTRYNINYFAELGLQRFSISKYNGKENGIQIKTKIEKIFGSGSQLFMDADLFYTAVTTDTSISLLQTHLAPQFKTKIKNVIINVGVNYIYGGKENSYFYPELLLSYGLKSQKIMVFAGLTQQTFTNSLRNLATINPYINNSLNIINNNVSQEIFGGLKGKFSYLSYNIKAGVKKLNNQAFYINNRDDIRYFDILYDDLNTVFVSGNLDFHVSSNFTCGGWIVQNIFDKNIIQNLWHTPSIEAYTYAEYKFWNRKLSVKPELYFNDRIEFLDKNEIIQKSNILFDLNTTISYSLSDNFMIEAKAINILDNKYQRWYGYPSIGINGSLGVKWIF